MKKINSFILMGVVVMMGSLSGCKKDKDPDPREAFVGDYALAVVCGSEGEVDQTISKSTSNEREIIFEDFLGTDEDVPAEVSGNSFTLKKTEITISDNGTAFEAELTGKGTLTGKELSLDFKLKGPGGTASCEAEGEKN